MADVSAALRSWSVTPSSNNPSGATVIGTGMDDNLRQIQATIRQFLAAQATPMGSSATVDLSTADGYYIAITGTTTITSLGTESAGISYLLKFNGSLTLTHNATSLILPGAVNITTAAGDVALMVSEGAGNWRCAYYQRANGLPVSFSQNIQDFRLTLTTGVPVTTSDVTAATTIYICPYKGKSIALYDGTNWNVRSSAQFSLALGTLTSGLPYDVFVYDNAGTPTAEALAWTNDTTRATALAYQDGVLVKSGAATRRYLGSFYTTSTTTTEDSVAKRYLWNYYHRVQRKLEYAEATAGWNYSTAAYQLRNVNAANQLFFICGVAEDAIPVSVLGNCINSTATFRAARSAIGLDSTTAAIAGTSSFLNVRNDISISGTSVATIAPQLGRHYVAALEYGAGFDTQTWAGNSLYAIITATVMG